ncbi:unnamed protein product [Arabidopsis arenosa]|uniref:CCHC-type domain-containing protein n=1 Tax=Arabidopsis arenosa TaxID=38785 RepID=A0A8S1ZK40_ARAAE|nr:unnamed protein product [Arabidopsis arenosa]
MTELIKGHPKLLRGLNVFLPEAKITIPTKANKGADKAGFIAKVKELMKNHRNILLGFSVYLSAGTKLTIPPEAEKHIAPSDNNKRKRAKSMIKIASDNTDNNKRKRAKCDDPDYDPDSEKKLKKRKRKGKNVSPPKKKVKLSKRAIHCKKCGQAGHNSRSCGKRALQACGSSGSQMKASQPQRNT